MLEKVVMKCGKQKINVVKGRPGIKIWRQIESSTELAQVS